MSQLLRSRFVLALLAIPPTISATGVFDGRQYQPIKTSCELQTKPILYLRNSRKIMNDSFLKTLNIKEIL